MINIQLGCNARFVFIPHQRDFDASLLASAFADNAHSHSLSRCPIAMAALAELNKPPPFTRPNPKLVAAPDDDDEDWAALEAAAQAEQMEDDGEDVDMDVLREIEAQEAEEQRRTGRDNEDSQAANPDTRESAPARMLLEEDDDFGAFADEQERDERPRTEETSFAAPKGAFFSCSSRDGWLERVIHCTDTSSTAYKSTSKAALTRPHNHDYLSTYGSVSNLNMSVLPAGYIEATPIQATRLDGSKLVLKRRKRLEGWKSIGAGATSNKVRLRTLLSTALAAGMF